MRLIEEVIPSSALGFEKIYIFTFQVYHIFNRSSFAKVLKIVRYLCLSCGV
jgi:hypothetical protein